MKDVEFAFREDMSEEERAWCRRFNKLIATMPRRFNLLECADGLSVVDRPQMEAAGMPDIHDGRAAPYRLADIPAATMKVLSVSG